MKNKILYAFIIIFGLGGLAGCNEDFLERVPKDQLSDDVFFTESAHFRDYANKLYSKTRHCYGYGSAHDGFDDLGSDVIFNGHGFNNSLYTVNETGIAGTKSDDWNNAYDHIRMVNYLLDNTDRIEERDADANQYIGEAYFFRARDYFNLLTQFGGVPIIKNVLNVDSEELYTARASRDELARFIIQDLDSAIVNMQWKNKGAAKPGRLNKESALVMKARVALFEGSWERYHGAKSTPYAVSGKNGNEFLNEVVAAMDELIEYQGDKIAKLGGVYNEAYNQLFAQNNGESVDGIFWYTIYNDELTDRSHSFFEKANANIISITRRLTDMYLDKDGQPQAISTYSFASMTEQSQNLEPRFRQTIWTPDRGKPSELEGRELNSNARYPIVNRDREASSSTGYRMWKGAVLDASQYRAGEVDEIHIRYGEGLLAYAEAKAMLGTLTQADLDKTVNVLRSRVDMAPMNLADVNSWGISYDEKAGFDASELAIVNEMRRERTVELALEGFRLYDLKRWAAYANVVNGYKPEGAPAQEFIDYWNTEEGALADDVVVEEDDLLVLGENIAAYPNGNIWPFFRSTQFQEGGEGFKIVAGRDYLSAIPKGQIDHYREKGVTLEQNPGWK